MKPLFLMSLFILLSVAQPAHAQVRCQAAIDAKLAESKVEKSAVKDIATSRFGTTEGGFQGYRAWVRLGSCRGYLVIELTDACFVSSTYTTRDCRVSGAPSY